MLAAPTGLVLMSPSSLVPHASLAMRERAAIRHYFRVLYLCTSEYFSASFELFWQSSGHQLQTSVDHILFLFLHSLCKPLFLSETQGYSALAVPNPARAGQPWAYCLVQVSLDPNIFASL